MRRSLAVGLVILAVTVFVVTLIVSRHLGVSHTRIVRPTVTISPTPAKSAHPKPTRVGPSTPNSKPTVVVVGPSAHPVATVTRPPRPIVVKVTKTPRPSHHPTHKPTPTPCADPLLNLVNCAKRHL